MRITERRLRHLVRQEILREEAPASIPSLDSRIEAKKREGYTEIPALTPREIPVGNIVTRCYVDHHVELRKYLESKDGWSAGEPVGVILYMTERWDGELVNKQGEATGTRVRGAFHDSYGNLSAEPDGTILRIGDSLFPAIPHRGTIYKILKRGASQDSSLTKESLSSLRRVILELALREGDEKGISAADFISEKEKQGYKQVSSLESLKLPIGDYGLFTLTGETPMANSEDARTFGPGGTSRYAGELRICLQTRSESQIRDGVEWDPPNINSCYPGFGFAYIISDKPITNDANIRGVGLIAIPEHIVLDKGGIKVGDELQIDRRGPISVTAIIVNDEKFNAIKPYLSAYETSGE